MKVFQRIHPILIFLFFFIIFFNRKLLPLGGNFIGAFDIELHFWNIHFTRDQILSGHLPLWNPYYYCGQPFLANPVSAVFYPSTLLFLALPLPWAFNIDLILHLLIAGTGMYFLVFKFTGQKQASILSSLIYCFNGYLLVRILTGHLNLFHSAVYIPWIFLCIENFITSDRKFFLIISGIFLGLQILSGDVQTGFYTGLSLTIFFFIRYYFVSNTFHISKLIKIGLCYSIIPITAIFLGTIQLLPSLEFLSRSQRAGSSLAYATYVSFPPANFFTFLISNPRDSLLQLDGEFSGYVGILTIFLAGIGLLFSKLQSHKVSFGLILAFSISIILGHYTPIYKIYYHIIPGISNFRIPSRCMVILVLCLSVLAGLGVQRVIESSLTRKQSGITIAAAVLILAILAEGGQKFNIRFSSHEMIHAFCFAIGSIVILFFAGTAKYAKRLPAIIIVFIFIDLLLIFSPRIQTSNENKIIEKRSFEKIITNDPGYYRILMPLAWYNLSRGAFFQYFQANGNASIVTKDLYTFVHEMADIPILEFKTHTFNPELFHEEKIFSSKIMGIKYGIIQDTSEEGRLLTASHVMPRATLVRNALVMPDLKDQINYMKSNAFYPLRQVLLQNQSTNSLPSEQQYQTDVKKDQVKIQSYKPNQIIVNADTPVDSYLVLSELFYPGWHAYVDGEELPVLRANFLLRAVTLKAGRHKVIFKFKQKGLLAGACISGLSLLFIAFLFLRNRWWKKGRTFNPSHQ